MKIALVLGSGGARGYAHIGVIEELRARGHEIVAVSGASMGALVGGLYAAGALDRFTDLVRGLTRAQTLRYLDLELLPGRAGFIRAARIVDLLDDLVGDVAIEDLPIPYTAVATDLDRRREVWFREGALVPAIRASIAIPTIFTPAEIGGRRLVDGGVLNPLPMEPALHERADLSVGVSLLARPPLGDRSSPEQGDSDAVAPTWRSQLMSGLRGVIPELPGIQRRQPADAGGDATRAPTSTTLEMLSTTLDVMQGQIELGRSAMNRPDILVGVPSDTCQVFDFHEADRVIEVGRTLARAAFDAAGLESTAPMDDGGAAGADAVAPSS